MGSHAWVLQLACKCQCPGRQHKPLATVKTVRGKRKVTGLKQALKYSSAYPAKMGIAVIQAWTNNARPENDTVQGPEPEIQVLSRIQFLGPGTQEELQFQSRRSEVRNIKVLQDMVRNKWRRRLGLLCTWTSHLQVLLHLAAPLCNSALIGKP